MSKQSIASLAVVATALATAASALADDGHSRDAHGDGRDGQEPKVMIVSMFGPEGQVWLDHLGPWRKLTVPGLSPDCPTVSCNRAEVCVLTTGHGPHQCRGLGDGAALLAPLRSQPDVLHRRRHCRHQPRAGHVGSVAWARYLVDFGIRWEIDAREMRPGWPSGVYRMVQEITTNWSAWRYGVPGY